jgi:HK97 family phage major capsid protein
MGVSTDQLKEWRFQRGKKLDEARAILEKAQEEGREDLNPEERATYEKAFKEQRGLKEKIEREEQQLEAEREVRGVVSDMEKLLLAEQRGKKTPEPEHPVPGEQNPEGNTAEHRAKLAKEATEKRAKEYCEIFGKFLQGAADARELRALQKDGGPQGGFLVAPETMVSELIANVTDQVVLRGLARIQTLVRAASLGYPRLKTRMSAASWSSELKNASPDTAMDFGKRNFFPHVMSAMGLVSEDLMALSTSDVISLVNEELARVTSELEEIAFMTGDGVEKPLGLFTSSTDGIDSTADISTDANDHSSNSQPVEASEVGAQACLQEEREMDGSPGLLPQYLVDQGRRWSLYPPGQPGHRRTGHLARLPDRGVLLRAQHVHYRTLRSSLRRSEGISNRRFARNVREAPGRTLCADQPGRIHHPPIRRRRTEKVRSLQAREAGLTAGFRLRAA